MTTMTFYAATPAQVSFINDLIDSRGLENTVYGTLIKTQIAEGTLSKGDASKTIDDLKKIDPLPKAAAYALGISPIQKLLATVPKSRYAVPADELDLTSIKLNAGNDYVFFEIREYMNNLYIRRLHGSAGGFVRSRLSAEDTKVLVEIVKTDPLLYTQTFGRVHKCCGKCGADLTDETSRKLQLGPECRKAFGF